MKTLQIKLLFFAILLFISVPLTFSGETKTPKWKVEFDDDINYYTFIRSLMTRVKTPTSFSPMKKICGGIILNPATKSGKVK